MRARLSRLCTVAAFLAGASSLAGQGSSIQYVYDELGRLVGVIDQNGAAASYHYDAVGNLTAITRSGSNQLSIIESTPNDGPVGGSVTIYGTGFSATPSENAVSFNGTAATIVSASANKLVVTIPSGATSGQLSVTTPNGNVSMPFVISDVLAPAITGLSSTIAVPGSAVSITGSGFDATAGNDKVNFNVSYASIGSASTTQIGATVPPGATSGHVSVATPRGTAVSPMDFFVPPPPNVAADVLVADRIAFSVDKLVSLTTPGKIALLLFDRTVGQRSSVNISNGTTALSTISIRDPYGRVARSVVVTSSGFLDTIESPVPGTYTVMVDPSSTYTGNNTLKLYDVPPDVVNSVVPGGPSVGVTTTVPGQNASLTFAGSAGERVSLRLSTSIINRTVSIVDPSKSSLASTVGSFIDTLTLSSSGQHTVLLDPQVANVGTMTVTLYEVPTDVTGSLSVGGSAFPINITTPGQNAVLTFDGTAGQRVSLTMTAGALLSGTSTIRKPDQTTLASGSFGNGTSLIEPVILPSSGTYSVLVDPLSYATGTVTLTLNAVPDDINGSIVPGGSAVQVTIAAPGQNARLTFSGTAGQRVSLSGTSGPAGTLSVLKPDQTTLASAGTGVATIFIDVKTLPTTGTYTVFVNPQFANTGSITVTLYDVPADVSGSLTVGGASVPVTTTVPGQNAALTFAGTAAQQVTVHITGNTTGLVTVKLLKPDGSTLTTSSSSSASFNLATQTLPTTGTYTITIDPFQANTGTMTVQVTHP